MKDIKKYYQDLIKDINLSNDKIVSGLKNHITWLENKMFKLQEESEKKTEPADLQKEIDEYNRLEAQKNMNLEDEITQLKAENSRLKKAYSDLEKAYKITVDASAPAKKTGSKAGSKRRKAVSIVAYCKDCGTYFQAKSKLAKYCSKCKAKHIKESQAKWKAKQK